MNRTALYLLACHVGLCLAASLVAQEQPTRPPSRASRTSASIPPIFASPLIFTAECWAYQHAAEGAQA